MNDRHFPQNVDFWPVIMASYLRNAAVGLAMVVEMLLIALFLTAIPANEHERAMLAASPTCKALALLMIAGLVPALLFLQTWQVRSHQNQVIRFARWFACGLRFQAHCGLAPLAISLILFSALAVSSWWGGQMANALFSGEPIIFVRVFVVAAWLPAAALAGELLHAAVMLVKYGVVACVCVKICATDS